MSQKFAEFLKSSNSFDIDKFNDNDNNELSFVVKSTKNIDYFDFKYVNSSNINFFVIIVERYIFYRDVFIFIDRLKHLTKNFVDEIRLRKLLLNIFRDINLK